MVVPRLAESNLGFGVGSGLQALSQSPHSVASPCVTIEGIADTFICVIAQALGEETDLLKGVDSEIRAELQATKDELGAVGQTVRTHNPPLISALHGGC